MHPHLNKEYFTDSDYQAFYYILSHKNISIKEKIKHLVDFLTLTVTANGCLGITDTTKVKNYVTSEVIDLLHKRYIQGKQINKKYMQYRLKRMYMNLVRNDGICTNVTFLRDLARDMKKGEDEIIIDTEWGRKKIKNTRKLKKRTKRKIQELIKLESHIQEQRGQLHFFFYNNIIKKKHEKRIKRIKRIKPPTRGAELQLQLFH